MKDELIEILKDAFEDRDFQQRIWSSVEYNGGNMDCTNEINLLVLAILELMEKNK